MAPLGFAGWTSGRTFSGTPPRRPSVSSVRSPVAGSMRGSDTPVDPTGWGTSWLGQKGPDPKIARSATGLMRVLDVCPRAVTASRVKLVTVGCLNRLTGLPVARGLSIPSRVYMPRLNEFPSRRGFVDPVRPITAVLPVGCFTRPSQ